MCGGLPDLEVVATQVNTNPLVFAGDDLFQRRGSELVRWDSRTMTRAEAWQISPRGVIAVQDETILVFAFPPDGTDSAVYRIRPNVLIETITGPIWSRSSEVTTLLGRHANELFVLLDDEVVSLVIDGHRAEEQDESLAHPAPNSQTRQQLVSRGDGRIIAYDSNGSLVVLAMGGGSTKHRLPQGQILSHLVAATGDRVWYTSGLVAPNHDARKLVLAAETLPASPVQAFDVSPGRIIHVASHADTVAALLVQWSDPSKLPWWEVALFDEAGAERWRVRVPDEVVDGAILNRAFVAVGARRVVLLPPGGTLVAWDAANGATVP